MSFLIANDRRDRVHTSRTVSTDTLNVRRILGDVNLSGNILHIDAETNLFLDSGGDIVITASNNLCLTASDTIKLRALTINVNGATTFINNVNSNSLLTANDLTVTGNFDSFGAFNVLGTVPTGGTASISHGTWSPTISLQGGSALNLTGVSATGHFIRIGTTIFCTLNVNFPSGTTGGGTNLGIRATIPTSGTILSVSGICNILDTLAGGTTFPATGNGSVDTFLNFPGRVNLTMIQDDNVARGGASPDFHRVNASFSYNI